LRALLLRGGGGDGREGKEGEEGSEGKGRKGKVLKPPQSKFSDYVAGYTVKHYR